MIPKSRGHNKTLNCVSLALRLGACIEKTVIAVWKNDSSFYAMVRQIWMATDICNKSVALDKDFAKFTIANISWLLFVALNKA